MDDTVNLTFWVTGIVFVAVNLFMAYCIVRYRHRKGIKAHYEPENKKLEWWLTIVTSVGIAAMLAPGLLVWAKFVTVPNDASEVEVVGQQWNWSYRFPGKDGVFGTTNVRLVSPDNPFGIDPNDPKGQDDVLVSSPEAASARRQAGEGAAARQGRPAPIRRAAVSGQDGHGARHGHLLLADPHPHRQIRRALRTAMRNGAFHHARARGRRR